MANEITIPYTTGATVYAVVTQGNQFANGATLEAYNAGHWTSYAVACTEIGATGIYTGSLPALAAGLYDITASAQAGGSAATTDAKIGSGAINWTGTSEFVPSAKVNVTQWFGTSTDPATFSFATLTLQNAPGTSGDVTLAASQPNYAPAKSGDTMTLTAAYDAAKTAASQTSVGAIKTVTDQFHFTIANQVDANTIETSLPSGGGGITIAPVFAESES